MVFNAKVFLSSSEPLIGRDREIAIIERFLTGRTPDHRVLFFEGVGGIGKTRLLTEALARARKRPHMLGCNIIDMYHARYHQPVLLMDAIVRNLRLELSHNGIVSEIFTVYDQMVAHYLSVSDSELVRNEEKRSYIEQEFIKEYSRVAEQSTIVLLFDTFEKLYPYVEETEEFNFRKPSKLEGWIINLIIRLPNTLTILAGRDRPGQQVLLKKLLGRHLLSKRVLPFTPDHTHSFLVNSIGVNEEISIDSRTFYQALYHISSGRPIILAIILALWQSNLIDITALPPDIDGQFPDNKDKLGDRFFQFLMGELYHRRPDLADVLAKAVYLRKGISEELLRVIANNDPDDIETIKNGIDTLNQIIFAKKVYDDVFVLHDEVYELIFNKIDTSQAGILYRSAIDHIDSLLKSQKLLDKNNLIRKEKLYQVLISDKLFYQIALDPLEGYQNYWNLHNNVVKSSDEDFDIQLQEELAQFFDPSTSWGIYYRGQIESQGLPWDYIISDEAVRWVHRYIYMNPKDSNRYLGVRDISKRIIDKFNTIYLSNKICRLDINVASLRAEIFVSDELKYSDYIADKYSSAIVELEMIKSEFMIRSPSGINRFERNKIISILAGAYNSWGYYERTRQRINSAITKYERAIILYRELGFEEEQIIATTYNNLGFAYARPGYFDFGLQLVDKALAIYEREGSQYQIASSLNTKARILMELEQLEDALADVISARQIFDELGTIRGRAQCAYAEAEIRRCLAKKPRSSFEKSSIEFDNAIERYTVAITLFDQEGELIRRVESRHGLGSAYRDRAISHVAANNSIDSDLDQALSILQEGLNICAGKEEWPIITQILEEIANIYIYRRQFDKALSTLETARQTIPSIYDIQDRPHATEAKEQHIFWLRVSQIEKLKAVCFFRCRQYVEACDCLVRAFVFLSTFSKRAKQFEDLFLVGKQELVRINDKMQIRLLKKEITTIAKKLTSETDVQLQIGELCDLAIKHIELL